LYNSCATEFEHLGAVMMLWICRRLSICRTTSCGFKKSSRWSLSRTVLIVCVGLVGNMIAFSALSSRGCHQPFFHNTLFPFSSRGCRGRRRRWRTHHTLAILLRVSATGDLLEPENMSSPKQFGKSASPRPRWLQRDAPNSPPKLPLPLRRSPPRLIHPALDRHQ